MKSSIKFGICLSFLWLWLNTLRKATEGRAGEMSHHLKSCHLHQAAPGDPVPSSGLHRHCMHNILHTEISIHLYINKSNFFLFKGNQGVGEIVQQLRALVDFAEDLHLVSNHPHLVPNISTSDAVISDLWGYQWGTYRTYIKYLFVYLREKQLKGIRFCFSS